ncbi:PIN domain-containing protein [Streptacidiphilus anmyonensis]|uniref:PIN domain-containing protein n=1 Tax=Streptacidiphilus anmyonensis TaxID=405782 RepID=UPI0005A76F3A|nr:PIN domain-containing protein [Streptacidiphilus anmyonensis]
MRLKHAGFGPTIDSLQRLFYENGNAQNGHGAPALQDNYLRWVEDAERVFEGNFSDTALLDGLHSRHYWEIRHINGQTPRPIPLILGEFKAQAARIEAAMAKLREMQAFAERVGAVIVPDTSALIQGKFFEHFDWSVETGCGASVRLVILSMVLEELDQTKDRDRGRAQKRARSVTKRLRELARNVSPGEPVPFRDGGAFEVYFEDEWHIRRPIPDIEIIDQALSIQEITSGKILLATADATMEFRARLQGLEVFDMPTPADDESDS